MVLSGWYSQKKMDGYEILSYFINDDIKMIIEKRSMMSGNEFRNGNASKMKTVDTKKIWDKHRETSCVLPIDSPIQLTTQYPCIIRTSH
jgi:hypothetical protein